MERLVRLWEFDWHTRKRKLIYEGDIEGLPEGEAKEYWEEIKRYHKGLAWEYFLAKAPPDALLYRGYALEPVMDEEEADGEGFSVD
ncbi:hypothetical protein [Thermus altitudinis]|uniref:hypothetical protein n=1 Tax=Thermus altitudinis TaxID=2908145 RepID=UPI001FA9EA09|nr:hypothetical protein [Thermus altitudinis]